MSLRAIGRSMWFWLGLVLMTWSSADAVWAQSPDRLPSGLTIDHAIQFGLDHYPSVRVALARVEAAKSGIDLTRTAYLPRVEMGFQQNMGTFNKASGVFFMTPYTPPIWGRQGDGVSYRGAWGSAAGTMAAWEPFDFGLRNANVEAARAAERQTAAGVTLTQLDVGLGVGDAFFMVLMAQQTVEAMKGNVERRRVFSDTVNVLVKNGLRPGVDASRALAELAMARTQLIQAEQAEGIARATLAEVLGAAGEQFDIRPGPLMTLPGSSRLPEPAPWAHPLAVAQKATADVFQKRKEALDRAWVPRFDLMAGFSSRGSSWERNGNREPGYGGLFPDVPNWVGGWTMSFQLFDFASIRAKRLTEEHNQQAELAAYDQVIQALTGKHFKAVETVKGANRIAENTPIQLTAARDTEVQARARYQTGLATVVEVAEAQQLVVQASIDDALARLGVWRSILGLAGARGDLGLFLNLVRSSTGQRNP
ncbi:MAG: TolC family protein [Nitrospirae bacterium]|nr:MAG: TolC family protein [Nitrospirota bacterium]